ncbi:MAG TPA: hypothetical protein VEI01_14645 [Terriglobales bacterium]|nr:hypothetical protein [Terriglobales bacterium]
MKQCLTAPARSVLILFPFALFLLTIASQAQTPDAPSASKSWTATSESEDSTTQSRSRTVESHSQNGNRTVDKRSVEVLRSGSFQPYQDIETESLKLNDTTLRTTSRTFTRNASGEKVLFQVTEEEKQDLPGGAVKLVRSTFNPDANGSLQLVQREVQDTKKTSPNVEETTTAVFLPGVNGGLAPAMKVQERQVHTADDAIQFRKSTLLPDADGTWRVGEVRQGTITHEGKDRVTDERVSRPGSDGQLVEVSRTLGKESQVASGEKRTTVETYSTDVPGSAPDGSLHLVQRVTTARRGTPGGAQTTHRQVEQVNPGDPSASLQIKVVSTDATTPSSSGTRETRTIQGRDANGDLNIISVDMTQSDKAPAIEVQIAPAEKPKSKAK